MRIDDVRLGTADAAAAAAYYRDVLELPVSLAHDRAIVTVGWSTVTLVEQPAAGEANHLAVTIPTGSFAAAKSWLSARTEVMTWGDGETELRLGEPWNSESVYFLGPDDTILELITRAHLDNATDEPFGPDQLLCVSEVGLAAPDVPAEFARVRSAFGVETFAGESPHFTTAGDQEGLLILVTTDRPWFPTADHAARTGSVAVTLSGVPAGSMTSDAGWTVTARP
jgi:catechol 2,3-dioxygenase-like lactoylglutathione lyase family enzyme